MSGTALAIAASLAALGYLSATDPKRRRVFRLPPPGGSSHAPIAWAAAVLPGLLLLGPSGGAGFTIWFGAAAFGGFIVALVPPGRPEALLRQLRGRATGYFMSNSTGALNPLVTAPSQTDSTSNSYGVQMARPVRSRWSS